MEDYGGMGHRQVSEKLKGICNSRYPVSRTLESISKPRLSTGSEFFIFNLFPRGHYLVWWVMVRVSIGVKVRVSVEVRVRVRVSNLLGSG